MHMDKAELVEAIEHHRDMIRTLRRRLRTREKQEAQAGISVDPVVINEIVILGERISKHKAELAELQAIVAANDVPFQEVEYRAALADAWAPGRPTYAGTTHLDWVRVRSGISPNQAGKLEQEVRTALAEEAFKTINKWLLAVRSTHYIYQYKEKGYNLELNGLTLFHLRGFVEGYEQSFLALGRAIRLDPERTIALLSGRFPIAGPRIMAVRYFSPFGTRDVNHEEVERDISEELPKHLRSGEPAPTSIYDRHFKGNFLALSNVEEGDEDYNGFNHFFDRLDAVIKSRQGLTSVDPNLEPFG